MSLFIVTGASRGFGLAVTQSLISAFPSSHVIVTARSLKNLETLTGSLERWVLDFSSSQWRETLDAYLTPLKQQTFDHVYVINNAGTLGPLTRIVDLDPTQVMDAVSTNLSANIVFTSQLLKHITATQWTLVNVSSLAA
jgi:NADP-dependent 3-hydroxy acid dehydrogenase YdfG